MQQELAGWGNYPRLSCDVRVPDDPTKLVELLGSRGGTIARGLGRSYGDPALNEDGVVVDMTRLDRFLSFDADTGVLECEAGVSLDAIIRAFAPRGFFPAITPGTKFVTVGGCIANDVHGKAHHADGCFSRCVDWFDLLLASGEVVRVSRTARPSLFWATVAGLGLTGIILRVGLWLRRIETTYFRQRAFTPGSLEEMLNLIDETGEQYPYSVAWIDPLATGKHLGRGVLTVGDHAAYDELPRRLARHPLRVGAPPPITVPIDLPNFALNPLTLRGLNVVLAQVQSHSGEFAHYDKFFYPLDAIGEWNRGYGPRGFTQYQFVIPIDGGRQAMRGILERIATSASLPFLNVLKRFGPANESMLSFPFEGYTFAIDFPIAPGIEGLCRDLDERVLDAGGRVYLGKDAFLSAGLLGKMYPRLDEWRAVKEQVDPQQRFRSHLSRRVGLTD